MATFFGALNFALLVHVLHWGGLAVAQASYTHVNLDIQNCCNTSMFGGMADPSWTAFGVFTFLAGLLAARICPPACATATKNRNKFIALRKRTGSASVPWRVLLLIFGFFRHVGAACTSCWGAAASDGCTGDATTCPWVIAVAANSATIGAMASGRLVVDKLLPKKILRLFSYRVLKIISMLYSLRAGEGSAANSLEESTHTFNRTAWPGGFKFLL